MARSYDRRKGVPGPLLKIRGNKRELVGRVTPGDHVEVSREIERLWDAMCKATRPNEAAPTAAFEIKVIADFMTLATGDGQFIFAIPSDLNGANLTSVASFVTTVSSSGLPTVQIRNVTQAVDMLTTKVSIDASEYTSYTAATPAVIDTANDDVATGDRIAIDVDVAGTGAKGLGVILGFGFP